MAASEKLLRLQLANWRFLDRLTEELDVEIDHELGPLRGAPALVETIPGISALTRGGNVWLKRALCQAAWAASHTRDTYFAARFRRLAAKRGKKRAILAVAHSLLVVIYTMLK